jgi:endonuclease/exonuclease/phosphatase family metal-dependent hydrolase
VPLPTASIINWNVEWATPSSDRGRIIARIISDEAPDVVCLTESDVTLLAGAGHVIAAAPDYGYPLKPGRRKVLLWSRRPWAEVDDRGSLDLPSGRYVAGRTETPVGSIYIVGVCIPWRDAHCRTGRRDRKPWQEHMDYLRALAPLISLRNPGIIIGDYNQRIPRRKAPVEAFDLLQATVKDHLIATAGLVTPAQLQTVDHIALAPGLEPNSVKSLTNVSSHGRALSDHFGVRLLIQAGGA